MTENSSNKAVIIGIVVGVSGVVAISVVGVIIALCFVRNRLNKGTS